MVNLNLNGSTSFLTHLVERTNEIDYGIWTTEILDANSWFAVNPLGIT